MTDSETRLRFYALYFSRFSGSFGFVTLVTLLPTYINELNPTAISVFGLFTISAGLVIGLYTTSFTAASTLAIVPMAWAGDRGDKRTMLLFSLGLGVVVYALFPLVDDSVAFIAVRSLQGLVMVGAGIMSLALVGELAGAGGRANNIGKANAASFAAGIAGSLSAGLLYDVYGFSVIFSVIVVVLALSMVAVWLFVPPDETRVEGFPFTDLALSEKIITAASFRAPYAVAVTLVRTWVPIYAGVSVAGGLGYEAALAISFLVVAEKSTNMVCQPFTGRLSDSYGRARFMALGGGGYGLVAFAVPFAPAVGSALSLPATFPLVGDLSAAFIPLLVCNALLGVVDSLREPASMALFADEGADGAGVASSFGIRNLVWRPGNIAAPLVGGWLMTAHGMEWVFFLGGATALFGVAAMVAVGLRFDGVQALTRW